LYASEIILPSGVSVLRKIGLFAFKGTVTIPKTFGSDDEVESSLLLHETKKAAKNKTVVSESKNRIKS